MSDPKDVPGLAHFLEHMLFMGTTKYPESNDFAKFISQNGGYLNAWTSTIHTNYFFQINRNNFEPALDRFLHFFTSPLFTESLMEKEINAVHQEHEKNLKSDAWRLYQFDKFTSNQNHPYSKFGTGNKDTLEKIPNEKNISVRDELVKFHSTYYSSNIMTLAVIGNGI